MSTAIKAIWINSATRSFHKVEIGGLKDMQKAVGGLIQSAETWDNGDTLYVDEEGLLKPQNHFFRMLRRAQPFAGNGLIVGSDHEGESVDAVITIAELTGLVTFLSRVQAEAWAKGNASEPASVIYSVDANGRVEETVVTRYGELFAGTATSE